MSAPLHIVHLEDDRLDAELIQFRLISDGIQCRLVRVENRTEFLAALEAGPVDLILSDHALPSFSGLAALTLAREKVPGIPFIFVSGAPDEDHVVEALRAGADNYVHKTRLGRLAPVIRHALRQSHVATPPAVTPADAERRFHALEAALRQSEERYRALVESVPEVIYSVSTDGDLTDLSPAFTAVTGWPCAEWLGKPFAGLIHPDDLPRAAAHFEEVLQGKTPPPYELRIRARSGEYLVGEFTTAPIVEAGRVVGKTGIARDITERKRTEAATRQATERLARWVSELEQRHREISLLNEMGEVLQSCLTESEAHTVIAHYGQRLFPGEVGCLCMLGPSQNVIEMAALWGDAGAGAQEFSPDDCWALRTGRIHRVDEQSSGLFCRHVGDSAPAYSLCLPMMAQGETLGLLHLRRPAPHDPAHDTAKLDAVHERLAISVAEHIALALANLKLHASLRSQAIRDSLTGLFNRRYLEESLERELRRAIRRRSTLGVILLDLDHFKDFNDTFGHAAGDMLLRELGQFLLTHIRGEDIACRYGGEEFLILLVEASLEDTVQRAEQLRQGVRHLSVRARSETLGSVSLSLGTAVFPDHGDSVEALLRAADAALYHAKATGRDRVSVAISPQLGRSA